MNTSRAITIVVIAISAITRSLAAEKVALLATAFKSIKEQLPPPKKVSHYELIHAINEMDHNAIKAILRQQPSLIATTDQYNHSPLYIAVTRHKRSSDLKDYTDIITTLIDYAADNKDADQLIGNALHFTIMNNQAEIAALILAKAPLIIEYQHLKTPLFKWALSDHDTTKDNAPSSVVAHVVDAAQRLKTDGKDILQSILYTSIHKGYAAIVAHIMKNNPTLIHTIYKNDGTPLLYSLQPNTTFHISIVKLLIDYAAKDSDYAESLLHDALKLAIDNAHPDAITYLITKDHSLITIPFHEDQLPLEYAITKSTNLDVVAALIDTATKDSLANALFTALGATKIQFITAILKKLPDLIKDAKDQNGATLLEYIATNKISDRIATPIIEAASHHKDANELLSATLFNAITANNQNIVRAVLKKSPTLITAKNKDNLSPLEYAINKSKNEPILTTLFLATYSPEGKTMQAKAREEIRKIFTEVANKAIEAKNATFISAIRQQNLDIPRNEREQILNKAIQQYFIDKNPDSLATVQALMSLEVSPSNSIAGVLTTLLEKLEKEKNQENAAEKDHIIEAIKARDKELNKLLGKKS